MPNIKTLSDFLAAYRRAKRANAFWYMFPRAFYPSEETLKNFHDLFSIIKDMQYVLVKDVPGYQPKLGEKITPETRILRKWDNEAWKIIYQGMLKKGIIKPIKGKRHGWNDRLANVRNYRNLLTKLGLGFVNEEKHFFLSEAGEKFIAAPPENWREIVERQLARLQFWNPSLKSSERTKYASFHLFPYLAVLDLMTRLKEKNLSSDEFVLFVAPMQKMEDVQETARYINAFRSLSEERRRRIVQHARISYPHRANAAVHLQMFGLTKTFAYEEGSLFARDLIWGKKLLSHYANKLRFIEYANFEDWYAFIGKIDAEYSTLDIAAYYADIGKTKKAKEILAKFKDDLPEDISAEEALKQLIQEKQLEDYLECHLSVVDADLQLLKRQFATEIGRIDLLAKSKRTGQYVVIELKRARASDKVMGQCLRYKGWVHLNLAGGALVKGIMVGDIKPELEFARIGLQHPTKDIVTLKPLDIDISIKVG